MDKTLKAELDRLRHGEAIAQVLEVLYEDWMNESDKAELVRLTLEVTGQTLEDIDTAFQKGLEMGYSIEDQVRIVRNIFANL